MAVWGMTGTTIAVISTLIAWQSLVNTIATAVFGLGALAMALA
jgi:hypothetical protein